MEIKETLSRTIETSTMVENISYFKYIFKKTEKIACAVFYILRSDTGMSHSDLVARDLEDTALTVLDVSLESLKGTESTIRERVTDLRFALISLESRLRVAHAARYISSDLLTVFMHEIDSVYRSMKKYLESSSYNPLAEDLSGEERGTERKSARPKTTVSLTSASSAREQGGGINRRERVLDILRDSPGATIRDISSAITDCSEKTIQRELNTLIKDNVVVRQGDRRWSTYRLA